MPLKNFVNSLASNQKWALKLIYHSTYDYDFIGQNPQIFNYDCPGIVFANTYWQHPVDFFYCENDRIIFCIVIYL